MMSDLLRIPKRLVWHSLHRLGLWGYTVEATTFVRSRFTSLPQPEHRFVIFGQGHTGSRLLCELLDSHPQITCDMEILNRRVFSPRHLIRSRVSCCRTRAYGFKLQLIHLTKRQGMDNPNQFLANLLDEGWQIIYLSRNMLRMAISDILRGQSGRSHRYKSDGASAGEIRGLHVDCDLLLKHLQRRTQFLIDEQKVIENMPVLPVVYDDHLITEQKQQQTVDRIVKWLGLEPAQTSCNVVRNTARGLRELIGNYDEVASMIAQTEFAGLLDLSDQDE